MPRFDPASYPGERPPGPVLVHGAEVAPLDLGGGSHPTFRLPGGAATPDLAVLRPGGARFSVAYGSNAAPARLMDKRLTDDGAILLPAVVHGWVAAFEWRRTGYGSVPLTFVPLPGAVTRTWVLGLPASALDRLDRTEGRAPDHTPTTLGPRDPSGQFAPVGAYQLGVVGDVLVADAWLLRSALAYLPGPATRVQLSGDGWRTWPEHDQRAAAAHVDRGGPTAPAPAPEPWFGPWPEMTLERASSWP